ncbi:ankyrin repeat-containing domain protein [Podospora didyma]|uniref:Ankyrin repeat-containing domain protein n=1 Tax=Podospora didyma TaxID=330526 RepID=A0AAE0P810_9PEZI|nr:ankyrin repeat-containing domain protein [Podospora didyma]
MASLKRVFGSVTLVYSGTSSSQPCTDPDCQARPKHHGTNREVNLVYSFPDWLVRGALSIFFSSNLNGSPELNIRLLYRIASDVTTISQSIFGYVYRRDVEGLKRLLAEKRGSVYDIRADTGKSPLYAALEGGDLAAVKVLLQAGADPWQSDGVASDGYAETPMTFALLLYIARHAIADDVCRLLPVFDHLQDEDVHLHLAIIGLLDLDIAEALQKPRYLSTINHRPQSMTGLSPLHLASMRGDLATVKLLLRAGASIDLKSSSQATPLHQACKFGHYQVARHLLSAGAQVNALKTNRQIPLYCASTLPPNPHNSGARIARLLLQHGADVNSESICGIRPLATAAAAGNAATALVLLEHGAHLDHRDWEGDTALFEGVFSRRHDVVRLLLAQGADAANVNDYGWCALHHLAVEGDVAMMTIFAERADGRLDTAARDCEGRTPLQLFNNRRDPTRELREAFDALLDCIEERRAMGMAGGISVGEGEAVDGLSDDEEYVDAQEFIA